MTLRQITRSVLVAAALSLLVAILGCAGGRDAATPSTPAAGNEVTGTLIAIKDDRPVDGGIDLTLETAQGGRELVRVGSIFIAGPRDSVRAMHEVVDASKVGDRLRARGARDEEGALRAQTLERLP